MTIVNTELFVDIPDAEYVCGLTPVQEGLLADTIYDPSSNVYHGQRIYRLPDDVDVQRVRAACELAVDRHEICRTAFRWEDVERPVQVVYEKVQLPWSVLDIDAADSGGIDAEIEQVLRQDRAQPFDLRVAPLVRFTLIRFSSGPRYLLWSRHHIILDRWSGEALIRQVMDAYAGDLESLEDEEALPFSRYVEWLEQRSKREAGEFWRNQLEGYSGGASLFGAARSNRGAADASTEMALPGLSNDAMRRLTTAARDCDITLNTIAQGAWAILVSKYTGELDVVHGTVTAGRSAELDGIEEALGLYINVLPIRSTIDPTASVRSWLQSWQLNLLAIQEFEYVPLRDIKRWSAVGSDRALFETAFSFASLMIESIDSSSNSDEWAVRRSVEGASYPLVVEAEPARNMELFTLYDPSYYSADAVRRLMEHYRNLLEGIANDPDRSIGSLRLLTDREREQQLVEWNDTTPESSTDGGVHQLFEEVVRRTPDQLALVAGETTLTYRELNTRANRLARRLREEGVRAETMVGVFLRRSPELVVAFLAVSKAGGTYLPLDPAYPADRLDYMLSDSGVQFVISRHGSGEQLREFAGTWIWSDDDESDLPAGRDDSDLDLEVLPDSLAYVIYTSGSTGRPKGSMIAHRGACNLVTEQRRHFGLGPGDRLPQFAALSFDASTFEFVLALCAGATLCLGPREGLDGDQLVPFLREHQITAALIPPVLLSAVEVADLPDLRMLWVAGEQCPATVVERWAPSRRFFNLYGPTEGTIWSTVQECEPTGQAPPIGRPIKNVRIYVLDRDLAPTPVGVPGDLYIGGVGLQRGYLGRAALTADRMVPNPFPNVPGERLYRTGDRARYGPDGTLEFLGRADHQLAIHGYRVEASEIEAQLAAHPAVREAVVLQQAGRLVAYVRA